MLRQLGLPMAAAEEQFRRMAFNVVARNQDDHVKNIAFLMDRSGQWSLAPAFDMTYSYRPDSRWTSQHQMSLNGKRDGFTIHDLREVARRVPLKRGRGEEIFADVRSVVSRWPEYAERAGVDPHHIARIGPTLRLDLPRG